MLKSVLVTGDAGALPYLQNDLPKNAFNFCCSCTLPKNEQETNLTPIKRSIKRNLSTNQSVQMTPSMKSVRNPSPPNQREVPWKWTSDVVTQYSNTSTMKKGITRSSYKSQKSEESVTIKSSQSRRQTQESLLSFGSPKSPPGTKKKEISQVHVAQQDHDFHEQVSDKFNHVFDAKMKQAKKKLDQQLDQNNPETFKQTSNFQNQYRYQLEMIRQRIKFDVAWQIFDEVNALNDTQKHIDLSCLDYEDAIIIAKQKIYELAKFASIQSYQTSGSPAPYVLNIKCAEDHLILIEDEYGRTPLKNCILEMIQKELNFDHYYISMQKTILVKVDHKSIQRFDQISR